MFESIQSIIKIRIFIVFLLIHAGLALGIFTLARLSFPNGWDLTSSLFLMSILCLYGGAVLGVMFVLIPILPWLRQARRVKHWSERVIESLPQLFTAFQSFLLLWRDAKLNPMNEVVKEKQHFD